MANKLNKSKISDAEKALGEAAIIAKEKSIKFIVTDYTVEFLANKVSDGEYYVPNYQRELVWTEKKQSRFIESLFMGLPIPFLFLWTSDDGRLEIVDGSQRLRTIVRFLKGDLKLRELEELPELNGFRFEDLERSRQRKFDNRTIRGIVLDNVVSEASRTEMFNRINTGGTHLNEAEIRRGSLPGPFAELVMKCASKQDFIELTPISANLVRGREREELVARFFTYLERLIVRDGVLELPEWHDRPREFIWHFFRAANQKATDEPDYAAKLEAEFERMLVAVRSIFPNGFRKSAQANQVPRARFEAISVGTALALRERPDVLVPPVVQVDWADNAKFSEVTTSDAANVKSKLLKRISFVYERVGR